MANFSPDQFKPIPKKKKKKRKHPKRPKAWSKPLSEKTSNNPMGIREHDRENMLYPYHLRYAQCKVMLDRGCSYDEIQKSTGLCHDSIAKVVRGHYKIHGQIVKHLRETENDKLTDLSARILDSVSTRDLDKASLSQKIMGYGILFDKRRLLDDKPTEIVKHKVDDGKIDERIKSLEEDVARLEMAGPVVDVDVIDDNGQDVASTEDDDSQQLSDN